MTTANKRRDSGTFVSPWAILSIVSATFIFCPLATLAGPLFGLKAFGEMRSDPRVTGQGMAKWGIIIGTALTIAWGGVAVWWHFAARRPMLNGPREALLAGFSGDLAGFRAEFCCEADEASDDDAVRFLSALSNRYGGFVNCYQNREADAPEQPTVPGLRKRVPYQLTFDRGTVAAEAEFVVFMPGRNKPIFQFAWLRVFDDIQGDITYPPNLLEHGGGPDPEEQTSGAAAEQTPPGGGEQPDPDLPPDLPPDEPPDQPE